MSFSFSGTNYFAASRNNAAMDSSTWTFAVFVKPSGTPSDTAALMALGKTAVPAGNNNDSWFIRTGTWANIQAAFLNTGGSLSGSDNVGNTISTWTPLVATYELYNTDQVRARSIVGSTADITSTDTATTTPDPDPTMYAAIGNFLSGTNGVTNLLLAEVAIWTGVLSNSDIDAYCGGTSADQISASTLQGYWKMNTNESNLTDSSGKNWTLTGSGSPTWSSDHPLIGTADIILSQAPASNPTSKIYMTWQT